MSDTKRHKPNRKEEKEKRSKAISNKANNKRFNNAENDYFELSKK